MRKAVLMTAFVAALLSALAGCTTQKETQPEEPEESYPMASLEITVGGVASYFGYIGFVEAEPVSPSDSYLKENGLKLYVPENGSMDAQIIKDFFAHFKANSGIQDGNYYHLHIRKITQEEDENRMIANSTDPEYMLIVGVFPDNMTIWRQN
jgi:hypothetical protein